MTAYRLDVGLLMALVEARRAHLGLPQQLLAEILRADPGEFERMSQGEAPDTHLFLALLVWLGCNSYDLLALQAGSAANRDVRRRQACQTCCGAPPSGFTCQACGAEGARP